RDAESHAADDRKRRDDIEARNRADAMIYNTEKTLKEHRDKIGAEEASNIEKAIEEAKKAMQQGDVATINAAVDKLTAASHKLAEAMYKAASQQPPPGAAGAGGPRPGAGPQPDGGGKPEGKDKDNVVDAEFVDMDDKGKK